MTDVEIQSLINDFMEVAKLSGIDISKDRLAYEVLGSPHEPPKTLPSGRVAVYVFCYNDRCLKVGRAGPKTKARFTSQHYNPGSASSTLADSLIDGQHTIGLNSLTIENVGDWIKTHTCRFNIFLNATAHDFSLNLLEVFLHARLNPVFEGSRIKRSS